MSLATRYRPKTLSDLRGQEQIENVLGAAFKSGRVASAYILHGIRGTGKTTTARIIARAMNCEKGPTLTPCGECRSCKAIDADSSLDVTEIDAASNTQVEKMRNLIENIGYAPMTKGAFKIYIIDEVHMLSNSSFNALLKTLEEPPEHAMFIFATTEMKKIPATVQSRCQVLSLRRIPHDAIVSNLVDISGKEGASIDPAAADLIARSAGGSMRDALSILDQAISVSEGTTITADTIAKMIGRANRQASADLAFSIVSGDLQESVRKWREILAEGNEARHLLEDLIEWFHAAHVSHLLGEAGSTLTLSDAEAEAVGRIKSATIPGALSGSINLLMEKVSELETSANADQFGEIIVVRLASGFARARAA